MVHLVHFSPQNALKRPKKGIITSFLSQKMRLKGQKTAVFSLKSAGNH